MKGASEFYKSPDLALNYVGGQYPILVAETRDNVRTWGGVYADTLAARFREWITEGVADVKIIPLLTDRSGL